MGFITLDRAETGNRVDEAMAVELRELAFGLAVADSVRVVILTGAGPVFSTGRETPANAGQVRRMQAAAAIAQLPMPVLVALNGDAVDHGLELALAGDMRLAARGAKFGFSAPSDVSFPFDGATQRLPRLVGPGWARDLLLTGRLIDAEEALPIGMAVELAEQIAQGSPLAARYAKETVNSGLDMTLEQGLVLETDLNVILQGTVDRAEGIASFLDRREPDFTGLDRREPEFPASS